MINNTTREGVDELLEYLKDDFPKLTLEQAKFKQDLGLCEWDPLPEGVEYPEGIKIITLYNKSSCETATAFTLPI